MSTRRTKRQDTVPSGIRVRRRQDSTVWSGGGFDPRISRNYAAFINNVGILFESPRQDMETGALTGLVSFKAVLQYAIENKDRLFEVVNGARFETIEMGQNAEGMIPVQVEYGLEDWTVNYDYASGPRDDPTLVPVTGRLLKKSVVLKERKRPYAYILEPKSSQCHRDAQEPECPDRGTPGRHRYRDRGVPARGNRIQCGIRSSRRGNRAPGR